MRKLKEKIITDESIILIYEDDKKSFAEYACAEIIIKEQKQ